MKYGGREKLSTQGDRQAESRHGRSIAPYILRESVPYQSNWEELRKFELSLES